jgi:hypothetical protein
MVYSLDNTKVITLKDIGEDRFLNELKLLRDLNHPSDERNRSWLDHLPHTYSENRYKDWFFLVEEDKMLAFATIQPFYSGCYRMVTRLYQIPEIRRFTEPKFDKHFSPSLRILTEQIKHLSNWHTLMISVQDSSRRRFAERYINKLAYRTDRKWQVNPDMMCMGPDRNNRDYWQNVMYTGFKPNLYEMPIEEWNQRWKKH